MADFLFKNPTQSGWPELHYRNLIQGTTISITTGSGLVSTVLQTSNGILKGIILGDFNQSTLAFHASGGIGTVGTFGSGALVKGMNACWVGFEGTLSVQTGTAQAIEVLVGTGVGPLQW